MRKFCKFKLNIQIYGHNYVVFWKKKDTRICQGFPCIWSYGFTLIFSSAHLSDCVSFKNCSQQKFIKFFRQVLKYFFEGLHGKGEINFWRGGSGFLEIAIINFTSRLLFELQFTCRLKGVSLVIFHLCF